MRHGDDGGGAFNISSLAAATEVGRPESSSRLAPTQTSRRLRAAGLSVAELGPFKDHNSATGLGAVNKL